MVRTIRIKDIPESDLMSVTVQVVVKSARNTWSEKDSGEVPEVVLPECQNVTVRTVGVISKDPTFGTTFGSYELVTQSFESYGSKMLYPLSEGGLSVKSALVVVRFPVQWHFPVGERTSGRENDGLINSCFWLIKILTNQQVITDDELIVDKVVLINKEPYRPPLDVKRLCVCVCVCEEGIWSSISTLPLSIWVKQFCQLFIIIEEVLRDLFVCLLWIDKRDLKRRHICGCRCNGRLEGKIGGSTRPILVDFLCYQEIKWEIQRILDTYIWVSV